MLSLLKQGRAALSLLNSDEVTTRAQRIVTFGLVADTNQSYAEMEDFLIPPSLPPEERTQLRKQVYLAGEPGAPAKVDLVLYQYGVTRDEGTYTFDSHDPDTTIRQILRDHDDLSLALARQYPAFRKPVVDKIIQSVARENALFSIATALPDMVPSIVELPWAIGEFASDTAFLTANQIRLAFLIAAAYGKEAGFLSQKAEILSIIGSAFGWRAIARELVGKIPLGGGLIPKGAIAYAGTFIAGKSLEYFYHANGQYSRGQRRELYREALEHGKSIAASLRPGVQRA